MTIQEFNEAIKKADEAAIKADPIDDGGTCNFDGPVIKLPEGIKKKDLEGCSFRIEPISSKGLWKGWYWVYITQYGQANRRTTMAEAAAKSLEESGIEASVYYQMD